MREATLHEWGRQRVRDVLDACATRGFSVVRTWAFSDAYGDGGYPLHPDAGPASPVVLAGLDFVVAEAGKRDLRLVLPIMGYWAEFGGLRQLQRWCWPGDFAETWVGVGQQCPKPFYNEPACRSLYLRHAQELTTRVNSLTGVRYADDPTVRCVGARTNLWPADQPALLRLRTSQAQPNLLLTTHTFAPHRAGVQIMIWELCNECRCRWGHESLYSWQAAMSRELKRLAPKQLVALGGDGFYYGEDDTAAGYAAYERNPHPVNDPYWYVHEGNDFLAAAAIASVDVVGYHLHPPDWAPDNGLEWQRGFIRKWVRDCVLKTSRRSVRPDSPPGGTRSGRFRPRAAPGVGHPRPVSRF